MAGTTANLTALALATAAFLLAAAGTAFAQCAKLIPGDAPIGASFGYSAAVSNNGLMLAGAPHLRSWCADWPVCDPGRAYVFRREGATWVKEAKLTATEPAAGDQFGYAVAISAVHAVVGAARPYGDDADAPGSAYVFTRDGTSWAAQAVLAAGDAVACNAFGTSVAIDGDVIVVGAPMVVNGNIHDPCSSVRPPGAAYVFRRVGSTWVEEAKLAASGPTFFNRLGHSVSVSGDTIVVGAPSSSFGRGAAFIFRYDGSEWVEEAKLSQSDPWEGTYFGISVSVDGVTVAVGADGREYGFAYLFEWDGVEWTELVEFVGGEDAWWDSFGRSVSIDGAHFVVGMPGADDACPDERFCGSGSAYLYQWDGTVWAQEKKFIPFDTAAGDSFGGCVSVSGNIGVIAAPWDDLSGAVYIYDVSGSDCNCNGIADDLDDCNNNEIRDDVDIELGTSTDCNGNCTPDECEFVDCNNNATFDGCDIVEGTSKDCNGNLTPDDCELDTDGDGVIEVCDNCANVANEDQADGDYDGVGDACDNCGLFNPNQADCQPNGVGDVCTIANCLEEDPSCQDCQPNGVPDECDIVHGTSLDENGDGIPDECVCEPVGTPEAETLPATPLESPLAGGTGADVAGIPVNAKNRFASIKTADAGRDQAIRVRFVSLPPPFDVWNGMDFYAGAPREVCENSGKGLETAPQDCPDALPTRTFWAAPLRCDKGAAHYMDWRGVCAEGTCEGGLTPGEGCTIVDDCVVAVHLYHEGLVPSGVYDVQVVDSGCSLDNEAGYSVPLTMIQSTWGDVCGPGPGGACSAVADGIVDVANDVLGVLDKFENVNNLQKARADLEPGDDGDNNGPDFKVNVANDVLYCLDAFTGAPYPFTPGDPCAPGVSLNRE